MATIGNTHTGNSKTHYEFLEEIKKILLVSQLTLVQMNNAPWFEHLTIIETHPDTFSITLASEKGSTTVSHDDWTFAQIVEYVWGMITLDESIHSYTIHY